MYVYIYICIYAYVNIYIYICMYVCTYMYIAEWLFSGGQGGIVYHWDMRMRRCVHATSPFTGERELKLPWR